MSVASRPAPLPAPNAAPGRPWLSAAALILALAVLLLPLTPERAQAQLARTQEGEEQQTAPLELQIEAQPQQLPQGDVGLVVVRANLPITGVEGSIAGRALAFDWSGSMAWAWAGYGSMAELGPRDVRATVYTITGEQGNAGLTVEVVPGSFEVEEIWVPPSQGGLLNPGVLNREWNHILYTTSQVTPQRYWSGPFIIPTEGPLSSPYGIRRSYNGGPAGDPHQGLDVAAATGSPVYAANSGFATPHNLLVRGNAVLIDHGLGLWSGYYHLSDVAVQEGQYVSKGDLIGWVGGTGLATGPHLHWDMVLQGTHTQPLSWTRVASPQ